MKFTPKSEKQIAEEGLLPEGTYGFEVAKAEDKVSKSGNDMIEVNLRVFNTDGSFVFVRDYLMEKISYKLRHFAEAAGLLEKYESGEFTASDCEGRTGNVKIIIKKDTTGQYPDKNEVRDYVVSEQSAKTFTTKVKGHVADKANQSPLDDSIPF